MSGPPTIIVCAAIITRPPGEILIAQRPPGGPSGGRWEFPGGKVEAGEDPRAALVRECREELDCEVEPGAIYETIYHRTERSSILLLFYLARISGGEPRSMECNALEWVTPQRMGEFDLLPADRPLIDRFLSKYPAFERNN